MELWLFDHPTKWTSEQELYWWKEIYQPHPLFERVLETPRWVIISGPPLSGKTVLLQALQRYYREKALILSGEEFLSPKSDQNFLFLLMRAVSWRIRARLAEQPEKIANFSRTQREFLRWAIEKFHHQRAFLIWLDSLPPDAAGHFADINYQELYPTQTDAYDIQAQIEEMRNICHKLQLDKVLILFDIPFFPSQEQLDRLDAILGWLEVMQHPIIQGIIALPERFCTPERLRLPRDRATFLRLNPDPKHTQGTLERYLHRATKGEIQQLTELYDESLRLALQKMLAADFHTDALGAHSKLLGTTLNLLQQENTPPKDLPLSTKWVPRIREAFYRQHCPLRWESESGESGVWRGYRWVPLEQSNLEFMEHLRQGKIVNYKIYGGSPANLNTLARRLRQIIEPEPSHPIYVITQRGEGYFLENYIASTGPRGQ